MNHPKRRGSDLSSGAGARWLWLSAAVIAADRGSKFVIEHYTDIAFRHPLVSNFVVLVHSQNPGIAFGVFSGSNSPWLAPVLLVAALLVVALLVWMLATGRAGGRLSQIGLALIIGGAAGNSIDRLFYGSVTDFFEVGVGAYRWPAFNAADSAITIGAALVLIELLWDSRRSPDAAEDRG